MNLAHARVYLGVIRAEEQRRSELLDRVDPNVGYDQWLFADAPFIGELCLVFLVALRHHVERQLLHFAARAADQGQPISRGQYEARVDELENMKPSKLRSTIEARLAVSGRLHYRAVEALRLLANAYKHNARKEPPSGLLAHLGLNTALTYAELPESHELRKGLAGIVGLPDDAGHCQIAAGFVERVEAFLEDVQVHGRLSNVIMGRVVSLTDFAH
jgi:hypothetical protein